MRKSRAHNGRKALWAGSGARQQEQQKFKLYQRNPTYSNKGLTKPSGLSGLEWVGVG